MASPVRSMVIVRYYEDGRPWDAEVIADPTWDAVELAVRQMDDNLRPIVLLSPERFGSSDEAFEDDDAFNVIGGAGPYALFQTAGEWRYEDPNGGTEKVRLWQSDQGYFCQERNVITDVEKVLRIVRVYYDSGTYEGLDTVR